MMSLYFKKIQKLLSDESNGQLSHQFKYGLPSYTNGNN